jgi:exodeoxyribonuclease VII large subunit
LLAATDSLAARFGALTVRGEISGFTRAASGHCYFTLKDSDGATALVRCAMFRRAAVLLDFAPADGQRVELRGRIGVYEPRGELQLVVEALQRQGAGSLYEEFLRLRARLAAQGLFDESRRRSVPRHPRCLGIVTSLGAAALHDVLSTLARRAPHVRVVVYPSPVQGADAPAALVAALALAGARAEADTLLLVRGGGSLEDLWSFNDERVVRAVAASPMPVICGVGHETDVTLCDLAADLRAPTPTAAAELAAPDAAELMTGLRGTAAALDRALARTLERASQRLDMLAQRAGRPAAVLSAQQQRLEQLGTRLRTGLARRAQTAALTVSPMARRLGVAMAHAQSVRAERLETLAARLAAAHPQHVLERGYAWVVGADGRPVKTAQQLTRGDSIEAVFADGSAIATVDSVRKRKG